MDLGIAGNAALTTASSSGLGKASARALAEEGANVVVNGRDEERLADAVAELREAAAGAEVVGQPGDLTAPDDVATLVERTVEEFGRLDHVVTSAGGPPRLWFQESADDDWEYAFDMLVMGVVRLVREAAPYLRDGGGSVVHITSISVKEANPSNVLSSSVRTSVAGLRKTLSQELAPEVRFNSVLPGLYRTPRREDAGDPGVSTEDIPLGRMGQPEELGEVVAFLCSERASYVNGVALPIDGGTTESNL